MIGQEGEHLTTVEEPFVFEMCPACGEQVDHCAGHGLIGDPFGHTALTLHDAGVHTNCHPRGCPGVGQ